MQVLLVNAGSSSLRCSVMEAADRSLVARATVEWAGAITHYEQVRGDAHATQDLALRCHGDAMRFVLGDLGLARERLVAVGHRIVHGGELAAPVRVTPAVRGRIAALAELAQRDDPPGLEALSAAEELLPDLPHVAVFDTAFHVTIPAAARTYAVPAAWTREWGIRKLGCHGLSCAYCTWRAADLLARRPSELRLVICHLGHSCSATAVRGGWSIDTTMGFTPLDGLMMATRSGAVDPGVLAYVQRHHGLDAQDLDDALHQRSGLLGVSGISADMRDVLAARRTGDLRAELAIAIYVHRVRQAIGALAVTLGGVDVLVFTAGVGEHAADIRAEVCEGLACLGLELDLEANARCRADADIARRGSRGRILVLEAREDVAMLSDVLRVIAPPQPRYVERSAP